MTGDIISMEHAVDELIGRLVEGLTPAAGYSREDADSIAEELRSTSSPLYILYILGNRYNLRPAYCPNHDGKWFAYGGSYKEAVRQTVFLYLNRKDDRPRDEQAAYRAEYAAVGGNEGLFENWFGNGTRKEVSLRNFLKLALFLDVPIEWREIPKEERLTW